MVTHTRKIAVLTGDLVGSTALGPQKIEQAFEALKDCAEMQAAWMDGQSLHFTRHRGDGWQVALPEPKYALRSALAFRAALRSLGSEFDSYIGIAEGEISKPLTKSLNDQTEPVFSDSGQILETIKSDKQLSVKLGHHAKGEVAANAILFDEISKSWTPAQAAPLLRMLDPVAPPSYTNMAKALGKTRQSTTKSLDSAGFRSIWAALLYSEGSDPYD